MEGDQPRVRPFGTAHIFEGKLYIQTGKKKDVSKQLHANPKAELCAFKGGEWIRVAGELVEDDRIEARQSMLDAYPSLKKMYAADDGNAEASSHSESKAESKTESKTEASESKAENDLPASSETSAENTEAAASR